MLVPRAPTGVDSPAFCGKTVSAPAAAHRQFVGHSKNNYCSQASISMEGFCGSSHPLMKNIGGEVYLY